MATIEKRTAKDGSSQYRVKIRMRGHRAASGTFDRSTDANRWAAKVETEIREGRYFQHAESKRHTLAELIDRYISEYLPTSRIRRPRERAKQLQPWRIALGHLPLADVTAPAIQEARAKMLGRIGRRGAPVAPATINRELASLSACLTCAVKNFGWIDDSPMRKLTKLAEPRGRTRFLSADERAALLSACLIESADLHCIVVLALASGARKGELLGLRWRDVDLQRAMMTFHETKNGERRSAPLGHYARDLLAERAKVRRIETDLVFASQRGGTWDVHTVFVDACQRAKLADFRFHDLRHSAASELAMNGATLAEIAEVLGHKTLAMVKRYAHLTEGHTRGVVERMNAKVFG